ncbi:MAG: glycosyltransferase family 2 protein [Bdellovibrio sp.]
MFQISIVIPVFNKSELTDRCLDSILKHSSEPQELIVIDNASKDDTAEKLAAWKNTFESKGWKFNFVTNPANVGFGRAMNQGARLATSTFLALVNNDTWLMPGWDKALLDSMKKHPEVSLLCPHIDESKPFNEQRLLNKGQLFTQKNESRTREKFCAVFLFFKTEDFRKIGAFDERYFVTYEDTDLKERMDREGYKYLTVGNCFIWHQSMATRNSASNLPSNYEIQGKALFMDKWGFDPSLREKKQGFRWTRRWERICNRFGFL